MYCTFTLQQDVLFKEQSISMLSDIYFINNIPGNEQNHSQPSTYSDSNIIFLKSHLSVMPIINVKTAQKQNSLTRQSKYNTKTCCVVNEILLAQLSTVKFYVATDKNLNEKDV